MRGKLFLIWCLFTSVFIFPQEENPVLSEIMFYPQSGNNEFIEVYNPSLSQSINLSKYKIKYYTAPEDSILSTGLGTDLPPQSFAVILEGDYDLTEGVYSTLIPPDALILKIADNAFGSRGMANTSNRSVALINEAGDTISVYNYSANNEQAISDEKITLNDDNTSENWGNSLYENGTPGYKNSITPLRFDAAVTDFKITPEIILENGDMRLKSVVKNIGLEPAENITFNFYNDRNFDSLGTAGEVISAQNILLLNPGDSVIINYQINNAAAGKYNFIASINFPQDENLPNNFKIENKLVYTAANNFNDIVINEIMYAPQNDEPEWIELYNRSSNKINLKDWLIFDANSGVKISDENLFIQPDSFLVIADDSTIYDFYEIPSKVVVVNLPSLNNGGDAAVIKDSLSVVIDSLYYQQNWGGGSGFSLERINYNSSTLDENNWAASESENHATPGKNNSTSPKEYDIQVKEFIAPQDFTIFGNSSQFFIKIMNNGNQPAQNYSVKIFDDRNKDSIPRPEELIRNLSSLPIASKDSLQLNFELNFSTAGSKYLIAQIDFPEDEFSTNNIAFTKMQVVKLNEGRNDLVINEIMYAPQNNEPEWIEIFNRSGKNIHLKNYKIADNKDTVKIFSKDEIINPGEYFVISGDSSIFDYYQISSKFIVTNFPSLNNSGDKLIILDSLNRVIDSLEYKSGWSKSTGESLERISPINSSIDSLNWSLCINPEKGTPGKINSVTQKDKNLEITGINFSPPLPLKGDNISIMAKIKNIGKLSAQFSLQLFEDIKADSTADNLLSELQNLTLTAGDSAFFTFDYIIQNIQSRKSFTVKINFNGDENLENNIFFASVSPGVPSASVIVNEIMFNPSNGEPEWIELYNTTNEDINLTNWTINDILTKPVSVEIEDSIFIKAKNFLVITKDSSIFNYHRFILSPLIKMNFANLNNDEDGIVLKDDNGMTIDSVYYFKDWAKISGTSTERITYTKGSSLASNWGSSTDIEQSTPGRINSIADKKFDLTPADIYFSPKFPSPGDNVKFSVKVKNNGSENADNFSIKFYQILNTQRILLDEKQNLNLRGKDSLIFADETGVKINDELTAAVKIIFDSDEDTLNNFMEEQIITGFREKMILINEVMRSPQNDEPEWIEFVNVSKDSINLKGWEVSDILPNPSKQLLIESDFFVAPGEYFIASDDSSFLSFHKSFKGKIIFSRLPSLNQNDGIILYDFRKAVIDSLKFSKDWGGNNGRSLERISLLGQTNDSTNWITSLSSGKSSPGKPNSILYLPSYSTNSLVINEIMFDPGENNCEFIEFYNTTEDSINIGGWKIINEKGDSYKISDTNLIVPSKKYFLILKDSSAINYYVLNNYLYKSIISKSGFSLPNSGGLLLLKDVNGNTIDSVYYSSGWQNKNLISTKNISLERINPNLNGNDAYNWNSSVSGSGATPAEQNSIFTTNTNSSSSISVSPNPFSPDNDGYEDFTIINYNLSAVTAQTRIKIFDSRGRLIRTLINNSPSGQQGSIIFDGLDDEGRTLRMGIYIVFLEALNQKSGVIEILKTVVVVAKKLN